MHFLVSVLVLAGILVSPLSFARNARERGGNCELRLISNASAGEAFLSLFTRDKEECLAKADTTVEAQYKSPGGSVLGKRGGATQQP